VTGSPNQGLRFDALGCSLAGRTSHLGHFPTSCIVRFAVAQFSENEQSISTGYFTLGRKRHSTCLASKSIPNLLLTCRNTILILMTASATEAAHLPNMGYRKLHAEKFYK
jgi:hypothetical protein